MSKSQIILIITGVVSVILLFSLPKIIIKSNKELVESKTRVEDHKAENKPKEDMKSLHKAQLSENEKNNINKLRNSFYSVSNKEKKTNFADSLIKAFRKNYQFDSAAKYAESIAELAPTTQNWTKVADCYMEAFNFASEDDRDKYSDKARSYYTKVIKAEPKNLDAKSKVAMTYISSDNPMQGIKILRDVLKEDPKNEGALFNLGILSIQSGQFDKAVKRFEELLSVNPNHATGQFYLGVSQANLGEKTKALESFNKARKMDADPEFQATVDSYIKELQ